MEPLKLPLKSLFLTSLLASTGLLLGACGGPDPEPDPPAAVQAPDPDAQPVPLHPLPVPPGEVRPPPSASEPGADGG